MNVVSWVILGIALAAVVLGTGWAAGFIHGAYHMFTHPDQVFEILERMHNEGDTP